MPLAAQNIEISSNEKAVGIPLAATDQATDNYLEAIASIPLSYFVPRQYSSPNCSTCPLRLEIAQLRSEKAYWRKMHQQAVEREARQKEENALLQAKLRLREKQLFARKSEKKTTIDFKVSDGNTDPKPRGQQPGSTGHGRKNYCHLPTRVDLYELPANERCCPLCGLHYQYIGYETSETIEIEASTYRRVYQRQRYRRTCRCNTLPRTVTAPAPPKLIPKGILGISIWVDILLSKFIHMQPTHRLLADLKTRGLDLAAGTVTGGLQTLAPLFKPLYEAIIEKHLSEDRWQADETRWQVFVTLEGKVGHRWYLWVFLSPSAVVYKLDPSRSAKVPLSHFSSTSKGIMVVDRYSAYKAVAKATLIQLAFCWSHVRRDFIDLANSWPQQQDWAFRWLEDINHLYRLNDLRLEVLQQPTLFAPRDCQLRSALEEMVQRRESQLRESTLHPACQKVLQSLQNHWQGLTIFADHPEVPMDNNGSERTIRGAVSGRKTFYGSGSLWSGNLTAMLFSLLQTLSLWKINPRLWLQAYLEACAAHQGLPPEDYQSFLPWNMSATNLQAFSLDHQPPDTS